MFDDSEAEPEDPADELESVDALSVVAAAKPGAVSAAVTMPNATAPAHTQPGIAAQNRFRW